MSKRTLDKTIVATLLDAALLGAVLVGVFCQPVVAGNVITVSGRKEGDITLQPNAVRVGNDTVPWADVMLVVNDAPPAAEKPAQVLRLSSGEILVGKITSIAQGVVTLDTTTFGVQKIAMAKLAAIDFVPGLDPPADEKKNSLYRDMGNSISGQILWLKEDRLALDAPIGAVELKLAGLKRYVFTLKTDGATAAADEVQLTDGSVVRGAIQPSPDGLVIKNDLLGKRPLGPAAWSTVRRFSGKAVYLADLRATVETLPLIVRPADPPRAEFNPRAADGLVSRLLIFPQTRMQYRLPGNPGGKYLLTGKARLPEGVRGAARLELRIDGVVRLEKTLAPGGEGAVSLSVELPAGGQLELFVDFAERVRFPCVVALENGLLEKK